MSNELYLEFHIAYADKKDKEVKKRQRQGEGGGTVGHHNFCSIVLNDL